MQYPTLFSPMKIGNVTIKNRIVMPPMMLGFANIDGTPTDKQLDYFEERAIGGAGLIIPGITRVNDSTGAAAFAQLSMSHDYNIEPMKKLVERVHKHGAKIFIQLHHPGRQSIGALVHTIPLLSSMSRTFKGFSKTLYKMTPAFPKLFAKKYVMACLPSVVSASKCEVSQHLGSRVRALRKGEIKKLIQDFVDAAVRCKKAGVDGVQLHGTHGYLIQQFLSPNTNHRTDEYGGSFENRLRFLKEIIEGIRKACGDYPIIVRLTVDECYKFIGKPDKGYGLDEGVKYAKAIEAMGVDAIDVSSANYDTINYWLEPTSFKCGWRAYMAKAVKDVVSIPVMGANLIRSAAQAEEQLTNGTQDFVCLGRPHIADPHWAQKVFEGKEDSVKRCICCLHCMQSMEENAYLGTHGNCSVNPTVGRETEFNNLPCDGDGRLVVVVGAGVAGLMSAEMLARRGFRVRVYEKDSQIGGQLQLANKPPHKEKISWAFEDLYSNAKALGVEFMLNTTATAQLINELDPYAVIIATGAVANKPKAISGVEKDNVFTTTDILSGAVQLKNKKVVLVGSGMTGLETAEILVADGNSVTIIEMLDAIAKGMWQQHLDDILPKLRQKNTNFVLEHKLKSITDTGIICENLKTHSEVTLDADAVVLSMGSHSINSLYEELKTRNQVFKIGDASKVGKIADATREAYDTAVHKIK